MYQDPIMRESAEKVAAGPGGKRQAGPPPDDGGGEGQLLKTYHPDYRTEKFEVLKAGPNKGEKVPTELAALLQANSRITAGPH